MRINLNSELRKLVKSFPVFEEIEWTPNKQVWHSSKFTMEDHKKYLENSPTARNIHIENDVLFWEFSSKIYFVDINTLEEFKLLIEELNIVTVEIDGRQNLSLYEEDND
jgi:hypothetical protein